MLLESNDPIGPTKRINTNRRGASIKRNERIFDLRNDLRRLSFKGTPSLVSNLPLEFVIED